MGDVSVQELSLTNGGHSESGLMVSGMGGRLYMTYICSRVMHVASMDMEDWVR